MTLAELDRLARAKILRDDLSKGILAMLAVIRAADAMRDAFGRDMGHWPPLGWTPVTYDAARAALKEK